MSTLLHTPETPATPRRAFTLQQFDRPRRHVMQCCRRALHRAALTSIAFVLAMFVVPAARAQAQAPSVAGTVVDAKTGLPLADAQVAVESGEPRTRTNIKGEFRLTGVSGAVRLVVTRIGFQPLTVTAKAGGEAIRVGRTEYAVKLEEIVVSGTAGDAQRKAIGNVIGKVDVASTVQLAPPAKVQDLLSVNVPGVRVMRASGQVGSGGITRIRAPGSMSLSNEKRSSVDGVRGN